MIPEVVQGFKREYLNLALEETAFGGHRNTIGLSYISQEIMANQTAQKYGLSLQDIENTK